jgi:hypothetical protein
VIGRCLVARAAAASQPSLLHVSGIAGIAIAAFCASWFAAHFIGWSAQ